jgi:hypothetical protein
VTGLAGFLLEPASVLCGHGVRPVLACGRMDLGEGDAARRVSTENLMRWAGQIRVWRRAGFCGLLCLAMPGPATATDASPSPTKLGQTTATTSTTTSAKAKHHSAAHAATKRTTAKGGKSSRSKKGKKRGQQAIDTTRARQIQTALIREHYMQGEPSGAWDSTTQAAMQKYQADQGWQSKQIPDSRALIKLGLGPSPDHLLNPESAMTTTVAPATGDPKAGAKPTSPENKVPNQ